MVRRLGSLAAILAFLISVVAWQPVAAQGATGTVTIHLQTCNVTGSADGIYLSTSADVPRYLRNCTSGSAGLPSLLQIDSQGPDSVTETEAVWDAVPVGDHTVVGIGLSGDTPFTVSEGGIELWATWLKHEALPAGLGTIVANLVTCDVIGTADSVTLFLDTPPSTLTNCRDGWGMDAGFLTLGGLAPDTYDGNVAIWYDLPYGDYFASAASMDPRGDLVITLDGENATFQASWDKHVIPESALPAGPGTVHIGIQECTVATGAPSIIAPWDENPSTMSNCSAARVDAKEWGLRVDGRGPDAFRDNVAVWTNLADGTHVATTTSGARYEFVAGDTTVNLIARFGPGGTFAGSAATTETPVGGAAVTTLPKTGAGTDSHDLTVVVALIGASLLLMVAGAFAAGTQRIRRS